MTRSTALDIVRQLADSPILRASASTERRVCSTTAARCLSPFLVVHSEHRNLPHGGMLHDNFLDVLGIHVHAAE
jgi:hypothetical protein